MTPTIGEETSEVTFSSFRPLCFAAFIGAWVDLRSTTKYVVFGRSSLALLPPSTSTRRGGGIMYAGALEPAGKSPATGGGGSAAVPPSAVVCHLTAVRPVVGPAEPPPGGLAALAGAASGLAGCVWRLPVVRAVAVIVRFAGSHTAVGKTGPIDTATSTCPSACTTGITVSTSSTPWNALSPMPPMPLSPATSMFAVIMPSFLQPPMTVTRSDTLSATVTSTSAASRPSPDPTPRMLAHRFAPSATWAANRPRATATTAAAVVAAVVAAAVEHLDVVVAVEVGHPRLPPLRRRAIVDGGRPSATSTTIRRR